MLCAREAIPSVIDQIPSKRRALIAKSAAWPGFERRLSPSSGGHFLVAANPAAAGKVVKVVWAIATPSARE